MKMQLLVPLLLLVLTSCEPDNFHEVTKIIYVQDTIIINKPFDFKLILRNDSSSKMKLTIDTNVQKSVFFMLDFLCDGRLLFSNVDNPKTKKHDYKVIYLEPKDSLVYELRGCFMQKNDTLEMVIDGYDRIYHLNKPVCDDFWIDFRGMWNPGDFNPFDAMEGYNFRKEFVVVVE